jgi:glycosyltransferase involved in cell wall biosynthesis
MRVALVIAGPYPAHRGSQVLVSHLALGLRGRGHDVHVVSYGPRRGSRPGPRLRRLLLDAGLVARLWQLVRRDRIDVLHAHNYEAAIASLLVGRATGCPVVYHGHAPTPTSCRYASVRRARWMVRLGRLLDARCHGGPTSASWSATCWAQLRRGVRRLPACLDPALAPNELEPVARGTGEDGPVCYAGNLDPYQRLDFLLDSFTLVRAAEPSARLRLVSHPDARDHAARLTARGLGPGVEVIVAQSYAQVRDEVSRAAVVVSPRAEQSGFPMKLLTYLALGKAIVACSGSAKGLVDGVNARVVADGDTGAFAASVAGLLRDPGARERLGRAARRHVEDRAAWDAGLDRIEAIYRRVLAAGAGRLPSPPVPVAATE